MNIYSSSFQLHSISIYTTFTLFVTWWNWWSDLIKNLQPIQEHSKTTRLKFKSKTSYNFPPGSSSPSFHDKHIFLLAFAKNSRGWIFIRFELSIEGGKRPSGILQNSLRAFDSNFKILCKCCVHTQFSLTGEIYSSVASLCRSLLKYYYCQFKTFNHFQSFLILKFVWSKHLCFYFAK